VVIILTRRSRPLLWAVLAMLACDVDDTSTLEIVVRVEPTLQVATALPAELLVGFDSSGSGYVVFRVGFLCGPPAPFVTRAVFSGRTGVDTAKAVDAWVVPVASGARFTCGPVAAPQPVPAPPARSAGARSTSAQVEVLGGCGAGELRSATLVIGGSA
jgi:hypothetical protein